MSLHPIVVDLDGTLICTDILHESILKLFRQRPIDILYIPYWLSRGKAVLKQKLADRVRFDPGCLPYNHSLLDWLKTQHAQGRKLILCTATNYSIASCISDHLGFFDEVLASNGTINLAGKNKADTLERRFGHAGFDYVGNSRSDLSVWARARRAIVVNSSKNLVKKAEKHCPVEEVIPASKLNIKTWSRVFRLHQWLKNLLLIVPLLASHQVTNVNSWVLLLLAFMSFSLCASSVYIGNDLLDLENDRQHVRKCKRPFASGLIPSWVGVLLMPLLLVCSFMIAQQVNYKFSFWLSLYFIITCAYSLGLKQIVLVDCLILAILYTLRVIAGTSAVGVPLSYWLLTCSIFLFLSLAYIKRFSELQVQLSNGKQKAQGRGYYTTDLQLIEMQGIAAGYVAVLVLALYLNSNIVTKLYQLPALLWAEVPLMLFWINWMWTKTHRGFMHDDPIIFAIKDKMSLLTGLIFGMVIIIATVFPW